MDLNVNKIMNGTPKKQIRAAHQLMKESYSEESARDFQMVYSQFPVRTVLENSRYVFSEPLYGLPYYKKIMESGCFPFETYETESEKVHQYLFEFGEQMNSDTKEVYQELAEDIDDLYKKHFHCAIAEATIQEPMDKVWKFCEEAYAFITGNGDCELVTEAMDELSPLGQILYVSEKANRLDLNIELLHTFDQSFVECGTDSSIDDYSTSMDTMMLATLMAHDKCIRETAEESQNRVFRESFKGLYLEDQVAFMENSIYSNLHFDGSPVTSVMESVNDIFNTCLDPFYENIQEQEDKESYDAVLRQYIAFEHCLDYLKNEWIAKEPNQQCCRYDVLVEYAAEKGIEYPFSVDDGLKLAMEATAVLEENLEAMEYTVDGRPSKIIQRHAMTKSERDPDRKTKGSEKSERWKRPDPDDDDDDDDPDDDTPKVTKKPELAKKDLHTKIQAKAVDADIKAKRAGGTLRKIAGDVVQTGKAVLRVPGNLLTGIKSLLGEWKHLDETKREEYMMKPGYRKKWYKSLKWAIEYGLAAFIHPLMIPVVWYARKASKEKNKFIQTELAAELATEIKVCEEKINDANNDNDKEAKWQLMRIRDKLEKERLRVVSNAKYV